MSVTATVLFDRPQKEIASLINKKIACSTVTKIVSGFVTPGGMSSIGDPIKARPSCLGCLVVGAATYPGFEALDELISAGVPMDRLFVHLGHSAPTGGRKNPFARYHPMLHSKIYYMELPDSEACAFIGSHNITSFALEGLNGEAAVLIEGPASSPAFNEVRRHIETAQRQASQYSPGMKEAYAWWTREFIDGLRAEMGLPQDGTTIRTIVLFASAAKTDRPKNGDHLYFELPEGIEQIESLKTETHLFLFDVLPPNPWDALTGASSAVARYTCKTLGAENQQGNLEVVAQWRIEGIPRPVLRPVPSGKFRPSTASGMQQVRAEIQVADVDSFEYFFERERFGWNPEFDSSDAVQPSHQIEGPNAKIANTTMKEAQGHRGIDRWSLVKGLSPRKGSSKERDEAALKLAAPESGSFVLVSVRRRRRDIASHEEHHF